MIALVDCDNFFASCERLFRPDLREKPVAVLSNNDGCIIARSNEVKALGVTMGAPYFQVKDMLTQHNAALFSANFSLYSNISQRILTLLCESAPQVEVYSIDEAFLNLESLAVADFQEWGRNLEQRVKQVIGIPVSIGIAPSKTLAKLASHYAKKQQTSCVLEPQKDPAFFKKVLEATPVGEVWGVGRRLKVRFTQVGIHNAWQLSQVKQQWLRGQLGVTGLRMHQELNGKVAYAFEEIKVPQKSLVASRSFGATIYTPHELETAVASFASQAAFRLRAHHQTTSLFGVYLRFRTPSGETKSQSRVSALSNPTNDTSELVSAALTCLHDMYDATCGYKKAGVFAYRLQSDALSQLSFFDEKTPAQKDKRKDLMRALDSINKRFGSETVHVATIDVQARQWHALRQYKSPDYTTSWSDIPLVYPAK